jgi:ubiquinone biosynthesis protein UbiJ
MLEIGKTIWDVAKGLFELREGLQKAKRDRKDRLAAYFGELAALLESVAASLGVNQYPHGSCAQLHTLALLMEETLKGLVPPLKAKEFQAELLRVWEIELLFGQLQSEPDPIVKASLNELYQAAGFFRATAAHLRVV